MSPSPLPLPAALSALLAASPLSSVLDPAFASYADSLPESLSSLREEFYLPTKSSALAPEQPESGGREATSIFAGDVQDFERKERSAVYLCGNSLGLMPRRTAVMIAEELDVWAKKGVNGHFKHDYGRPWKNQADQVLPGLLAGIVGGLESEVACMGSLTSNLHHLMCAFYRPTTERFKILFEGKAFPSDQYAFRSQVELHNLDPNKALLEVFPRTNEWTLRTSDILDVIEREGHQVALVIFSGVQYFSAQRFDMKSITAAARAKGCVVGWDLAHGVGNVPLELHDWGVDFAAWCTYKYLNSGPGGVGGIFVHERHHEASQPRLSGWWGQATASRFDMPPLFTPAPGAAGFQLSTPPALEVISLLSALQTILLADITASSPATRTTAGALATLRKKSVLMSSYLYTLLINSKYYVDPKDAMAATGPSFTIISPVDPEERGAQLSLLLLPAGKGIMQRVFERLEEDGVIGDERQPDVIRLSPVPMYNSFEDCATAVEALNRAFEAEV